MMIRDLNINLIAKAYKENKFKSKNCVTSFMHAPLAASSLSTALFTPFPFYLNFKPQSQSFFLISILLMLFYAPQKVYYEKSPLRTSPPAKKHLPGPLS